jgi:competence protein ComFC
MIKYLLNSSVDILADIFYPKFCFGCGKATGYLCQVCKVKIQRYKTQRCIVCKEISHDGVTHTDCMTDSTPDSLICMYPYQNELISQMVISGKYYFVPELFTLLTSNWFESKRSREKIFGAINHVNESLPVVVNFRQENLSSLSDGDVVVTALPLHKSKLSWRGFNQSEIIAKEVAVKLNLKYMELLTRNKSTKIQKDLDKQGREKNMQNAFEAASLQCADNIPDIVILVDDVTTTGSSLFAATESLKSVGIKNVVCLCLAIEN